MSAAGEGAGEGVAIDSELGSPPHPATTPAAEVTESADSFTVSATTVTSPFPQDQVKVHPADLVTSSKPDPHRPASTPQQNHLRETFGDSSFTADSYYASGSTTAGGIESGFGGSSVGTASPTTSTAYAVEGGDSPELRAGLSLQSTSPSSFSAANPPRLRQGLPSFNRNVHPSQRSGQESPMATPASEKIEALSLTPAEVEERKSSFIVQSSPDSTFAPLPHRVEPAHAGEVLRESTGTEMQPIPLVELANSDKAPLETLIEAVDPAASASTTDSGLPHLRQNQPASSTASSSRSASVNLDGAVASASSQTTGNTDYHLARTSSAASSLAGRRTTTRTPPAASSANNDAEPSPQATTIISTSTSTPDNDDNGVESLAIQSARQSSSSNRQLPPSPSSYRQNFSQTRGSRADSSMTGGRSATDYSTSSIGHSRRFSNDSNAPIAFSSSTSARPDLGHDGSQANMAGSQSTSTRRESSTSRMQQVPSTSIREAGPDRERERERERERTTTSSNQQQGRNGAQDSASASAPKTTKDKEREKERVPSSSSRRQLGEWTLGKTLGAGSMGKVKLGVSSITGSTLR